MSRDQRRPRGRRGRWLAAGFVATLGASTAATACDVCAIYTATELRENRPGLEVGVGEQFTNFATRQLNGEEVANPGEFLRSSITQVLVAYNLTSRFGLQLNLPIIVRDFRRLEDGQLRRGNESGFGDLALTANFLALSRVTENSVLRFSLLGGLKLPSGNPSRLSEELAEGDEGTAHDHPVGEAVPQHVTSGGAIDEESAIHGHDLALGSGSVDGIVGGSLFWSWRRLYVTAGTQYAVRTEGAFDYRYANDLTWAAGPGVFALLRHDLTLGVQAVVSGETKGKDTQQDQRLDDTGVTLLYAGPALGFTWGSSLGAELSGGIPVIRNNTALQIVPDFRIRGGATWRF